MSVVDHKKEARKLWVVLLSAILGWLAAMIWDLHFVDAIAAIVNSILIIKWSLVILQDSFSILFDIDSSSKGRNYGFPNGHYHH